MPYRVVGTERTLQDWLYDELSPARRQAVGRYCLFAIPADPHNMPDAIRRGPLDDTPYYSYTVPVPGAQVVVSYTVWDAEEYHDDPRVCFNALRDDRYERTYAAWINPPPA